MKKTTGQKHLAKTGLNVKKTQNYNTFHGIKLLNNVVNFRRLYEEKQLGKHLAKPVLEIIKVQILLP